MHSRLLTFNVVLTLFICGSLVLDVNTLSANDNRTKTGSVRLTKPFLNKHCSDCHTGETAEMQLDVKNLSQDLSDKNAFDAWVKIYDRVLAGEMPPQSE